MGVKLRVELSARVMGESRDDPVRRSDDRALPLLFDTGLRRGRLEISERLGHGQVVGLGHSAVVADKGQQRHGFGSAEGEIPAWLMLALLPALERHSVR